MILNACFLGGDIFKKAFEQLDVYLFLLHFLVYIIGISFHFSPPPCRKRNRQAAVGALPAIHRRKASVFRRQLLNASPLDNLSVLEVDDLVAVCDGRNAVRGDEKRPFGRLFFYRSQQFFLRDHIQGAGSVVENEHGAFFINALATESRCFCPPESPKPRSPTIVS